jgi:GT2 family glycosyltransferase
MTTWKPTKVIDLEMSQPLRDVVGLDGYERILVLVRLHGAPIGYVRMPITGGRCAADSIMKTILEKYPSGILSGLVSERLKSMPNRSRLRVEDLFDLPASDDPPRSAPTVTIAVCTRDRTADLKMCLDSLERIEYPALDIIVVDNAPATDGTERLLGENYPSMRYVREPRPGLDWARNRAIIEARGEIVAFADDDVVADPHWVRALADVFAESPDVMGVTGLVVPYEIETEAQYLFECFGGFGRGFDEFWVRIDAEDLGKVARLYPGPGIFGTGANMAFRRRVFNEIGYFDPALDVGTVTNGGGDLDMFFRVIKEGHTLVYQPRAIVYHRHRKEYAELHAQITNWGIAFYSYLVRNMRAYPDERMSFYLFGMWWILRHIKRLVKSALKPWKFKKLILAELRGSFIGMFRYQKARVDADRISGSYGPQIEFKPPWKVPSERKGKTYLRRTVVRSMDVSLPIYSIDDVQGYNRARVYVAWKGRPLGSVEICGFDGAIGASRLRRTIASRMPLDLFESNDWPASNDLFPKIQDAVVRHYLPPEGNAEGSVSVVVATLDRPDDLRGCLKSLVAQKTSRRVEIIVVDNNPSSGRTPPVVAEFPGVRLTAEHRKGLSYARNKGIVVSTGDIIAATDDDTIMPDDWLENLIAPFARDCVMVVTGNVLPMELETPAQRYFEQYGGLGRGFSRREVGLDWFESIRWRAVPTWTLGATACAAFRTDIFRHPSIGLIEEALGPGMPSGVGEDTYIFYKVLKEGYTIVYEPKAFVWHKHRRSMKAFRRQIYNYSKGHVAYHLFTLFRDRDPRALLQIFIHLPLYHVSRIMKKALGKDPFPLSLRFLEIAGNLAGPFALWRSLRRVKREGRSEPFTH